MRICISGVVFALITGACQNASAPTSVAEGELLVIHGQGSQALSRFLPDLNQFRAEPAAPYPATFQAKSFRIIAGLHAGKVLTVGGSSADTSLYDPVAGFSSTGPSLPVAMAPTGSAATFPRLNVANAGEQVFISMTPAATAVKYSPGSHSFLPEPAFLLFGPMNIFFQWNFSDSSNHYTYLAYNPGIASMFHHEANATIPLPPPPFPFVGLHTGATIPTGAYAGQSLIVSGANTAMTFRMIPSGGSVNIVPGPSIGGTPLPGDGVCSFVIESGAHAGKILVVHGAASTTTSLYDPLGNQFVAGPPTTANVAHGAHAAKITTGGHAGKVLLIHGGNTALTSLYDPVSNTFIPGPALPAPLGAGGHSISLF